MTAVDLPTILIVDDDRVNRAALAQLLEEQCRILLAKDGPSALEILRREDVSLVLLDVSMPGMDGYEVLRRIKEEPKTSSTTVIFITGLTEMADEEHGLLLGAADYVPKPIRPAIVRARVNVHLRLAAQRRELELLSQRDALTGIANRRYFDEALGRALRQMGRGAGALGLAILDVDHFKQYNDFYGHGAGDEALRTVSRILDGFARRPGDVAARYGGEEFVLLMPMVSDFEEILDNLKARVLAEQIAHEQSSTALFLTISGGAVVVGAPAAWTGESLLAHADKLLYSAKRNGRNRILVETLAAAGEI